MKSEPNIPLKIQTYPEREIWFHHRIAPHSDMYQISLIIIVKGRVRICLPHVSQRKTYAEIKIGPMTEVEPVANSGRYIQATLGMSHKSDTQVGIRSEPAECLIGTGMDKHSRKPSVVYPGITSCQSETDEYTRIELITV